jgi:hypothetical protein
MALVLLAVAYPNPSYGTVLIPKDLPDLVTESSDIIIGSVQEIQAEWNSDRTRIYTRVVLEVEKAIKGDFQDGEILRFKTIGGVVEEVSLRVPGSPEFEEGQRVIVFFGGDSNLYTPVTGWEQGKFTVESDIILENGRYLDDFVMDIQNLMTGTK